MNARTAGSGRASQFAALLLPIILLGCAVGPNFTRPAPPAATRYTASHTPLTNGRRVGEPPQRVEVGKRVSAQWWGLFRSTALNTVVLDAVQGNQTLNQARATLAAAQQEVAVAEGGLYPQLSISADAARSRSAGGQAGSLGSPGGIGNFYSVGANVGYNADVFGATRRKVEQQRALAALQGYQLAAAYLSLTGNAVSDAITIGSLRAQIVATDQVISGDRQNLALVKQAFEAGKVARTDVLTAETQLASDRTTLPPLRQQLSAARHALAVLTGHPPAQWSAPPFDLEDFSLPRTLPLSLPSELVRQRPDILAAEAQLAANSAAIGVATAQLYPNIVLNASIGQQALSAGALFEAANRVWGLSGDVLAPLFQGGALRAQRRAAIATYRASLAAYQQTVLAGLQQVADTLRALLHDGQLVAAQQALLDTASQSLALQRASYAAGKSTVLNLIDAERIYEQARINYVRAHAQRLEDSAQLLVALGGGWWKASGASLTH